MPPIHGQIGGLFIAAFVIQLWRLCREKIMLVTDAITKEVHNPLVEQMTSPRFHQVKSVGFYNLKKKKKLSHLA